MLLPFTGTQEANLKKIKSGFKEQTEYSTSMASSRRVSTVYGMLELGSVPFGMPLIGSMVKNYVV